MRISKELVMGMLEQVPENIKEVATSDDIAKKVYSLGQKYDLHIDKIGILNEETLYVILGLESTESYISQLSQRLGIDKERATNIANEINNEVLSYIRKVVLDGETEKNTDDIVETKVPEKNASFYENNESHPERDSILNDIENPKPIDHPIDAHAEMIQKQQSANSFVSEKLNAVVNTPPQKTVVEDRKYQLDPYREPIE